MLMWEALSHVEFMGKALTIFLSIKYFHTIPVCMILMNYMVRKAT